MIKVIRLLANLTVHPDINMIVRRDQRVANLAVLLGDVELGMSLG